jgi:hypothetical protein
MELENLWQLAGGRRGTLANLHGEPTITAALAKLWVKNEMLENERDALVDELRESSAALDESGRPGASMVQPKPGGSLSAINAALVTIKQEIAVLL